MKSKEESVSALPGNSIPCAKRTFLEQYLLGLDGVTAAKVYERTADAVIYYKEDREAVLVQVAAFDGQITEKQEMAVKSSGRALIRGTKKS